MSVVDGTPVKKLILRPGLCRNCDPEKLRLSGKPGTSATCDLFSFLKECPSRK
jgi:hypothetical protein